VYTRGFLLCKKIGEELLGVGPQPTRVGSSWEIRGRVLQSGPLFPESKRMKKGVLFPTSDCWECLPHTGLGLDGCKKRDPVCRPGGLGRVVKKNQGSLSVTRQGCSGVIVSSLGSRCVCGWG